MKKYFALILTIIALAALSSCSASPTPAPATELAGSKWKLAEINGTAVDASVEATMAFDTEKVSGKGGCNTYSGSYALTGSQIEFSGLGWTKMACQDPAMSTEFSFLSALESGGTVVTIDGALELNSVDGTILRFTAQ
jgi:putative lipoprotein